MASESEVQSVEAVAEAAWRRGDFAEVASIVFSGYGAEIYSFLLAQFRVERGPADDVFSDFSEDFWKALPLFQWRCSMRGWCYKLARSAASRYQRAPQNRRNRRIPISEALSLEELAERARTTTRLHVRTEVKDKIRDLREQLSREDQDLLVLRVDRELSWQDVAHAMWTGERAAEDEEIVRFETALRQRFTEIKKRLRRLAEDAGLI